MRIDNPSFIDSFKGTDCGINGVWGMAKPLGYGDGFLTRIKHAIWVLKGKARAVVFLQDYVEKILPQKKVHNDLDGKLTGCCKGNPN